MRKFSLFMLWVATLLVISLASCKKSKTEPDLPKSLFTIDFTDNYIKKQLSGFILVSDPQGKFLGDTICNANGKYPVYLKSNSPVPTRLTITVGYYEIIMHILTIHLNTYKDVAPFGEWKMKGSRPDTVGHTTVSLTNLPVLVGPIIYSNAGYSNMTFGTSDQEQMLYLSPDDLYVKIKAQGGDKFKWQQNIKLSETYTIDMSDAGTTANHTISFPVNAQDYDVSLYGYKDTNYDSPLSVLTDRVISDGTIINNVNLAFPPSTFSGFLTDMMIRESYTSDLQWFYCVTGVIPDQFRKIDASINSVDAIAGHASLNASGTFMMSAVNWQFVDMEHTLFDWNIFGPDTAKVLSLPVLSPNIAKLFPNLKADSMAYASTELRYYPNLNNYQDILRMLFDPERTNLPADFEMRSVKKNVSGKQRKVTK